ncbi:hypothetical protein B0H21DRAFT_757581 [Amylocystis lapponica]|nr:hypothetical protein B0H21DRAFT_757581 [Amylocystis lapponica]
MNQYAAIPQASNGVAPTVLSAIQSLSSQDALSSHTTHSFSANPDASIALLREIIATTSQISQSFDSHLSSPLLNPKLPSLYRQHSAISHTVNRADQNIRQTLGSLRKRVGINYGEDIPLDRTSMVEWCISRLETWGTAAAMESFREEERQGRMTVVLGGKVLVVDIDFSVDRADPERPKVDVANLKTSYAFPNGASGSTTQGSLSLDGFLADGLQAFLTEAQKEADVQDSIRAARLGTLFAEHLSYLMRLDQLALREGDGGLRWFKGIDSLALEIEQFATREAQVVTSTQSHPVPLDVFLMRSHTLPLPYISTPSISFLVHLSPLAYLHLLRTSASAPSAPSKPDTKLPAIDISFAHLRSHLSKHPRPEGATVASLILSSTRQPTSTDDAMGMPQLSPRPSFTLVPAEAFVDNTFPQPPSLPHSPATAPYSWVLDFTDGGKYPGVVMSQSRMREIELVINPLSGLSNMGHVPMMAFGTGSWLHLLLSPQNIVSSERYTALYTSPTSAHPPLQLRLTAPEEPGFVLETVPVRNMKEVWAVLEVVREQCWLNETLRACHWTPEGLFADDDPETDSTDATTDDLQAVLNGTLVPRRIPVNVYLPSPFFDAEDSLSLGLAPQGGAKIVMTCPERPPISGLVQISVAFDPSRPWGVALHVNGAMGVDLQIDVLEQVCRRGGLLGLPGRIWAKAHGNV